MLALLMSGLVAAQLVTLVLTIAFPPERSAQYRLTDIAAALTDQVAQPRFDRPLLRQIHTVRPNPDGPGWQMSERAQEDLARELGVDAGDVEVLFYSPPPFAGVGGPRPPPPPGAGQPRPPPFEPGVAFPAGPPPARSVGGDFIAALRLGPDEWAVVRPRPEGLLTAWQLRLLLWFGLAFAIVAPLGFIVARRLAAPLDHFAAAAERLGRDPTASVVAVEGPAELGRAVRAFNTMQDRLRRYIDDRTAMIGAISHDLRTPLARMRFRLERAPAEIQREMAADISQMDEMIESVLSFLRDSGGAGRQRVDLRSLLEVAADDAAGVGGDVALAPGAIAEVEVDILGIQRVFANLIDNALKYGGQARIRLFIQDDHAIAEIIDAGPGLGEEDLEKVFTAFYRGAQARTSAKHGVGLGLTVSRSVVRAHGGDVILRRGEIGLIAQVRLPLSEPV